jgi:hypothetical protein
MPVMSADADIIPSRRDDEGLSHHRPWCWIVEQRVNWVVLMRLPQAFNATAFQLVGHNSQPYTSFERSNIHEKDFS